jgi:hypothetical protein
MTDQSQLESQAEIQDPNAAQAPILDEVDAPILSDEQMSALREEPDLEPSDVKDGSRIVFINEHDPDHYAQVALVEKIGAKSQLKKQSKADKKGVPGDVMVTLSFPGQLVDDNAPEKGNIKFQILRSQLMREARVFMPATRGSVPVEELDLTPMETALLDAGVSAEQVAAAAAQRAQDDEANPDEIAPANEGSNTPENPKPQETYYDRKRSEQQQIRREKKAAYAAEEEIDTKWSKITKYLNELMAAQCKLDNEGRLPYKLRFIPWDSLLEVASEEGAPEEIISLLRSIPAKFAWGSVNAQGVGKTSADNKIITTRFYFPDIPIRGILISDPKQPLKKSSEITLQSLGGQLKDGSYAFWFRCKPSIEIAQYREARRAEALDAIKLMNERGMIKMPGAKETQLSRKTLENIIDDYFPSKNDLAQMPAEEKDALKADFEQYEKMLHAMNNPFLGIDSIKILKEGEGENTTLRFEIIDRSKEKPAPARKSAPELTDEQKKAQAEEAAKAERRKTVSEKAKLRQQALGILAEIVGSNLPDEIVSEAESMINDINLINSDQLNDLIGKIKASGNK